jgi:hypothetical protein
MIFFALKNPTASAGFEPANLGTKGQHATSRPPKPPVMGLLFYFSYSLIVSRCVRFELPHLRTGSGTYNMLRLLQYVAAVTTCYFSFELTVAKYNDIVHFATYNCFLSLWLT